MADNVAITAGSGTNIATDDVSSVHYQKVKLDLGGDGLSVPAPAGGGVEATALRVTIANDSTGVLSVDDNGGSLTVDGTVAVSSISTSIVPGTAATNLGKAEDAAHASGDTGVMALTVRSNTAASTSGADGDYQPLITDTNGRLHVLDANSAAALTALQLIDNIVLTEDAAHVSGDPGVLALAVRRDANTTMVSADGDNSPLQVDANGNLKVNIVTGGGSGGTSSVDDAAFTVASGSGTPIMGYAAADSVDSGDVGVVRMTTARGLHTVAVTSTGTTIDPQVDDAAFTVATSLMSVVGGVATSDAVDSGDAGAFAMTTGRELKVTVDASATNFTKAEDVASANADVGVPAMAIRQSSPANTSGTNGDYEMLQMNAGRLWTSATVDAALPAGTNNIGDVDVLTIAAGTNLIGDVGLSGARTTGGTTAYKNLDVDETEDDVKTSAGQVYWIHAVNLASTKRYLKFYNATAANVTVGTTTPVLTFTLPTQGDTNGAGFNFSVPNGIAFSTAICIAATTGFADNDTGAPGANEVIVNLGYA